MALSWVTAFLDSTPDRFDESVKFWTAVTGWTLSSRRGEHGQFATLVPSQGDAYLRVQRVRAGGGLHLDLHVDDVEAFTRHAEAVGALVSLMEGSVPVMTSPAGMIACAVSHRGEKERPASRLSANGIAHRVDQVGIDIPASRYEEETRFWTDLTGWELRPSQVRKEFSFLVRPDWSPLRLLLQRRDDDDGPARAHLDIAAGDVDLLVAEHQSLGASIVEKFEHWTAMRDPTGFAYCITGRDPTTGLSP